MRQLQSAAERETAASQCPIDPPPSPAAAAGASTGGLLVVVDAPTAPAPAGDPSPAPAPAARRHAPPAVRTVDRDRGSALKSLNPLTTSVSEHERRCTARIL